MTREIPLTQGKVALVDDGDFALVNQYRWNATKGGRGGGYYARTPQKLLMHRIIVAAPDGVMVDHINRNGLDNRRSNLRLATASQNGINQSRASKLGFRGVYAKGNRFRAYVCHNLQRFYAGSFETAEEAARAYDRLASELHGEFAQLNFPEAA